MIKAESLLIQFPVNTFKTFSLRKFAVQKLTSKFKIGGNITTKKLDSNSARFNKF